ncbi:hypothetical protein K505DRAFT_325571 [Melanomma pulvis-pyrius CBS 109.77]|uniref:Uncharacterized protein n=1 Tax=Melanomma pulvis-pyrius CBS 109.77 TaxID=1314802 RepID=A0A6A6XA34_9PLEO|nr:hypothetical protein K505DRAFT_325571 [Melanomma pulvis-pyrius CBS 109.77]
MPLASSALLLAPPPSAVGPRGAKTSERPPNPPVMPSLQRRRAALSEVLAAAQTDAIMLPRTKAQPPALQYGQVCCRRAAGVLLAVRHPMPLVRHEWICATASDGERPAAAAGAGQRLSRSLNRA